MLRVPMRLKSLDAKRVRTLIIAINTEEKNVISVKEAITIWTDLWMA